MKTLSSRVAALFAATLALAATGLARTAFAQDAWTQEVAACNGMYGLASQISGCEALKSSPDLYGADRAAVLFKLAEAELQQNGFATQAISDLSEGDQDQARFHSGV